MKKAEFIQAVAEKAGLSKKDTSKAVDAALEAIKDALVAGDSVSFIGFGTFGTAERAARKADFAGKITPKHWTSSPFRGILFMG